MSWTFLVWAGLPLWVSIFLVIIFAVALGLSVEYLLMRPMVGQPILSMVIVTLALGAFLAGVGNLVWGKYDYYLLPAMISKEPFVIGGMRFSMQHVVSFGITLLFFGIFTVFFRYTRWGLEMQAVANDHQAARSTGISTKVVFALSWVVASIVAAIAGVVLGQLEDE